MKMVYRVTASWEVNGIANKRDFYFNSSAEYHLFMINFVKIYKNNNAKVEYQTTSTDTVETALNYVQWTTNELVG